jgi:hypothetical protein
VYPPKWLYHELPGAHEWQYWDSRFRFQISTIGTTGLSFNTSCDSSVAIAPAKRAHPEEERLWEKVRVSGLSPALKTAKRAELAAKLAPIADVHVETELKIGPLVVAKP